MRSSAPSGNPRRYVPQLHSLVSIVIIVTALYLAQTLLIPLALAVLISFVLAPLVARVERLRLGRIASVLIVVAISLAAVGSVAWALEQRFAQIVVDLPEYRQSIQAKFHGFMQSNGVVETVRDEIKQTVAESSSPKSAAATRPIPPGVTRQFAGPAPPPGAGATLAPTFPPATPESPLPVRIYPQPDSMLELAFEYLGKLASPFLTAGLVVILVIFILLKREDLRDRIIYLLGHGHLHVTIEALDDAALRVSRYLLAQSIINALFGALVAAGLWIIDVTFGGRSGLGTAVLAGLLCGILRFIPYVGTWIGASLPLAFAFAVYPNNTVFFATLAMFIALELFVSQAVEPKFLGASTGISPLAVLVATVFWAWLWGPIGLLLSTPLTVLLVVMGKYVPQLEYLDVLLGDTPVLEPPLRIYQRLVAGDDQEAMELALAYLKEMPLDAVYDDVLVPALEAAQRDWLRQDLDEPHYASVLQGFKAIVEAVGAQPAEPAQDAAAAKTSAVSNEAPAKTEVLCQRLPGGCDVHVVCLPLQTEADEIVGLMLSQLLVRRGYRVTGIGAAALASESVELIERVRPHLVVISALPPKAAMHARYVLKKLFARFPDLKVVLGLWTSARQMKRTGPCDIGSLKPATTLAQAQEQLDQLVHQILIEPARPSPPAVQDHAGSVA